jgi:hypothetical protein
MYSGKIAVPPGGGGIVVKYINSYLRYVTHFLGKQYNGFLCRITVTTHQGGHVFNRTLFDYG